MNPIELGENIRFYRKKKGMTQNALADKLSVSYQAISNWERGVTPPDLDNLCRLSKLLELSLDALVFGAREKQPLYVSIDGGGTKTNFAVFSAEGHILMNFRLGPANPNDIGLDGAAAVLSEGIERILTSYPEISGVLAGVAGVGVGDNAARLKSLLSARFPQLKPEVVTDLISILSGVHPDCRMALISGTGSSLFIHGEKEDRIIGGWGYLLDEAGSGYDIGRDVLRACLAVENGYGEKTVMTGQVNERLNGPVFPAIREIYRQGKPFIASFAPVAFEGYRQGDRAAAEIVRKSADRLAFLVNYGKNRCGGGTLTAATGGLFENFFDILEPEMRRTLDTDVQLLRPALSPIYGTSLECLKRLHVTPGEHFTEIFAEEYDKIRRENHA